MGSAVIDPDDEERSGTTTPEADSNKTDGERILKGNRFLNMKMYVKNRTLEKGTGNKYSDNVRNLQDDGDWWEEDEEDGEVKIVKCRILSV